MLGGMFAGHEEGGGKKVKKNGSQFIEFYGSSSRYSNYINIMVALIRL